MRFLILSFCLGIFSMQDASALSWWDITHDNLARYLCLQVDAKTIL